MSDTFSTERPTILSNPHADRVKKVARLVGRSARSRSGHMLVEGPQAVRELLIHRPRSVVDVYLTTSATSAHPEIGELAHVATRWVHEVTDEVAAAMSGDAQGILAVARLDAIDEDSSSDARTVISEGSSEDGATELPVTFVCVTQGRDPGNLGTIIRTADAMGASAVVLCAGSVDVRNPKVVRSSAGSVFHLPVIPMRSFDAAVEYLRGRGAALLGTSGSCEAEDLSELIALSMHGVPTVLTRSHAWLMGNEAKGLSEEELAACDSLITIPMTGQSESLNVASAASICLYASQLLRGR